MTQTPTGQDNDPVEGSLTDGGSLPGARHSEEARSFGAGREGRQAEPAEGTSGSTGASRAGEGSGDRHLGTAGLGGAAAGDQQTEVPRDGRVDTGQPR